MPRPVVPAARTADIRPFHVMALLERAGQMEAAGRDVVHMEIGEPDFDTPPAVVEAGVAALQRGATHYTPTRGLPLLREAIAGHYGERYGTTVDPDRILLTPGASGALLLVFGALLDPGDEVLMADPGYPCNRNFARFVEGRARLVPVGPETEYQLTADLVDAHWGPSTRAVLVASPANPPGTLLSPEALADIATVVDRRGGRLVVDEIYQGLLYDTAPTTALAASDEVFVVNSFSKYFQMTGWRLGWIVAPPGYMPVLERLAQNLFLAAPTPAQHAALAAFEPATLALLEERRAEFGRRRDLLVPGLRDLGFDVPVTPRGAFYVYADGSRFTDDSFAFAERLLEEVGVAVTPGIDFGDHAAGHHLRFAYTTSYARIEEGLARLQRFVGG